MVQKTSLKLLLVFVEYTESNAFLVWQAALAIDEERGAMAMKGIADILNVEQDGATDEDLLVYAMTLVNKILYALPEQSHFYDVVDALEEQNMENIIQVSLPTSYFLDYFPKIFEVRYPKYLNTLTVKNPSVKSDEFWPW